MDLIEQFDINRIQMVPVTGIRSAVHPEEVLSFGIYLLPFRQQCVSKPAVFLSNVAEIFQDMPDYVAYSARKLDRRQGILLLLSF